MVTLIIQGPRQIVMISEEDMDIARKIYLNGKHPEHVIPQPNGNSVGHWEGDTLVIDTIGFAEASGTDKGQHVPDLQINENVCEEGIDRYQVINGSLDNPNIPPSRDAQK